ncbi:MAG: FAD binding domain-containing protein [Blautia sp.]
MNFYIPKTQKELADALDKKDENTYLCAGGTDLVIHLRSQKKFHYSLIDLTHVEELKKIEEMEEEIWIGAAVTMTELEKSPVIQKYMPGLAKAASMVGSTQIRNRATIGGNIANASQSSDTMPVLFAYETEAVVLNDMGEEKRYLLEDLIEGLERNRLEEKEVLTRFIVKKDSSISGFSKVGSRKAVTISKINGCVKTVLKEERLTQVIVYLGAVGAKAARAGYIERALEGQKLEEIDFGSLKEAVYAQIEANIPNRSSKHYKKSAAFGVLDTILEELKTQVREVKA